MGMMWPGFLFLLGLIPFIIGIYIWLLKRRRRYAVRYSSLVLIRAALPKTSQVRRHLPFALFLLAMTSLILALARPVSYVRVPLNQASIILAMDVSLSMCQTDIEPNRLVAAQKAALSFIREQPPGTSIGIVAFAGFAALIQPPTTDPELLEQAVMNLYPARRTAIGSAIVESLDAISEFNPNVQPVRGNSPGSPQAEPLQTDTYAPDIIVLLTDGSSNSGPIPQEAALLAAERGVRIYTIGFGTNNPGGGRIPFCGRSVWNADPQQGDYQFWGGFGGGGGWFQRGIDERTLIDVAEMTGGEYYSATSAGELQEVFRNLPSHLITRLESTEISALFAALGTLLAVLAIALGLLWNPLP